ncbi:zinc ribbon domain-containing protein [Amycolatopsis jejuensis]|uniref:zinc ribbon domain-containing protein n=1 Tax=Amycolatopsis jejuensis TaxID=330084 RepID=UPI003CCBA86B
MRGIAKLERDRPAVKNVYLLKGLIRCEICGRKMQGAPIRKTVYYRCMARTLAPGSPALESHPKTVNLREDVVTPALNGWLCQVCSIPRIGMRPSPRWWLRRAARTRPAGMRWRRG